MRRSALVLAAATTLVLGCSSLDPGPPPALPSNSFAFAVFGDAPYYEWEEGRYHRVLADVDKADVAFVLHVGDLFWRPCSDEHMQQRLAELNAVTHPVIYTPGDNEWTDCHERTTGGYAPLERLATLRRVFFAQPGVSLGAAPLPLETQASDTAFAEFAENHRWRKGGFVFATVHVVGSRNAMRAFEGRTAADDAEAARRMQAAIAWTRATFDTARATGASGVVIVFHAEIGLVPTYEPREGYEPFIAELQHEANTFDGQVLAIHGDSHQARVDEPRMLQGGPSPRFTRIETFGSPDVGWMRVVIDSVAGRMVNAEKRRFRGWW